MGQCPATDIVLVPGPDDHDLLNSGLLSIFVPADMSHAGAYLLNGFAVAMRVLQHCWAFSARDGGAYSTPSYSL